MIEVQGIDFAYRGGDFRLRIGDLRIEAGAAAAVIGPSGCGKTTLLHLVAGVAAPQAGRITVEGTCVSALADSERRAFRAARIGLVFQEFELLEYLSVLDNILLPYRITNALALDREARQRAAALAADVGLGDRLRRRPRQLSHGERQRVAVCRALATRPRVVLADEPTGNLDPKNAEHVLDILFEYARSHGVTLLAVTHDHSLLDRFDRVVDAKEWA